MADFPIPAEALDDRIAIVGTAGAGKTYSAGTAVERLLSTGQAAFHAHGPRLRLLDPILDAYPDPIASEEVAAAAGYSSGSGNFNNLRGSLRSIGLIDYPSPGQVRAADWLFPGMAA